MNPILTLMPQIYLNPTNPNFGMRIPLIKPPEIVAHMNAAYAYAALSYCERRQVGCVMVRDGSIIAIGYNGTPSGELNVCEDDDNHTKSTVVHAEENALRKLIRRSETSIGCLVFVTTAPCIHCAEKLISAGVVGVFYDNMYNNDAGIQYLRDRGCPTIHTNVTNRP